MRSTTETAESPVVVRKARARSAGSKIKEPAEPAKPTELDESAEPAEPAEPDEPDEPGKPVGDAAVRLDKSWWRSIPGTGGLFGGRKSAPTVPTEASEPPDFTALLAPPQTAPAAPPAPTAASAPSAASVPARPLAVLEARDISAWFGDHKVLDRVSLTMEAGKVTALIGPSGCGKSTFLRILNRMHQQIPSASLAGEVLLDGTDIYDLSLKLTDARRHIGMVFQKPNPFPAMSIYDNVVSGGKLTGLRWSRDEKDEIVERNLIRAGLWNEVKDRLKQPGGSLSGGQQQRLCIARSLAVQPRVLLMDEPCSALDPTSTRIIEDTMIELQKEVTIVIVNPQHAAGPAGLAAVRLLSRHGQHPRCDRRVRRHRRDVQRPAGCAHPRLRQRRLRLARG